MEEPEKLRTINIMPAGAGVLHIYDWFNPKGTAESLRCAPVADLRCRFSVELKKVVCDHDQSGHSPYKVLHYWIRGRPYRCVQEGGQREDQDFVTNACDGNTTELSCMRQEYKGKRLCGWKQPDPKLTKWERFFMAQAKMADDAAVLPAPQCKCTEKQADRLNQVEAKELLRLRKKCEKQSKKEGKTAQKAHEECSEKHGGGAEEGGQEGGGNEGAEGGTSEGGSEDLSVDEEATSNLEISRTIVAGGKNGSKRGNRGRGRLRDIIPAPKPKGQKRGKVTHGRGRPVPHGARRSSPLSSQPRKRKKVSAEERREFLTGGPARRKNPRVRASAFDENTSDAGADSGTDLLESDQDPANKDAHGSEHLDQDVDPRGDAGEEEDNGVEDAEGEARGDAADKDLDASEEGGEDLQDEEGEEKPGKLQKLANWWNKDKKELKEILENLPNPVSEGDLKEECCAHSFCKCKPFWKYKPGPMRDKITASLVPGTERYKMWKTLGDDPPTVFDPACCSGTSVAEVKEALRRVKEALKQTFTKQQGEDSADPAVNMVINGGKLVPACRSACETSDWRSCDPTICELDDDPAHTQEEGGYSYFRSTILLGFFSYSCLLI